MSSQTIGRNEKCPCGSGKKFKFCHGQQSGHTQQLSSAHTLLGEIPIGATQEISMDMFPGEQGRLSLVPNNISKAGEPGKYHAIFVLRRLSKIQTDENHFDFSGTDEGDSHLAITAPAFTHPFINDIAGMNLEAGTEEFQIKFKGSPNKKGYLGRIESDSFDAFGFEDAESKAYHLLVKILSSFSAELDIPVQFAQMLVIEDRTSARSLRIDVPPTETPLNMKAPPRVGAEFSYYASLYREGLNSNSVIYRFLCFFKIIEGIRARRERLIKEALASGQQPIRRVERFPSDPKDYETWLKAIYPRIWKARAISQIFRPEIIGKKFNNAIDNHLVPLRNTVAHAILDSGELGMSADDLLKLEKVNYWLPAIRIIVRRMLRNEFPTEFLTHLPQTGDIQS